MENWCLRANLEVELHLIISKLPKTVNKTSNIKNKCKVSFFKKFGSSHNTLTLFGITGKL